VVLHWILSSKSISVLYWGAQRWTQHSRCGLSHAGQSRRITSLDLLATLLVLQPWMPLTAIGARAPVEFDVHKDPQLLCKAAFHLGGQQHNT